MIWMIVTPIVAIYIAWVILDDLAETVLGKIFIGIFLMPFSLILAFILGILIAFLFSLVGFMVPTTTITISETPIYSLVDKDEYEGHFVLGSGYAKSDLCIYYVAQTDECKTIELAKRENTVIIESNDKSPTAVITGERYKFSWINFFVLDPHGKIFDDKVTLTVPVGTVTTEYNIDLK